MPTRLTPTRLQTLFVLGVLGFAQDAKPPQPSFSLTLSMPETTIKAGSPVMLTISVTNTSDHLVVVMPPRIDVYDSEGKPVPETERGMERHGKVPHPGGHVTALGGARMAPGKSGSGSYDLREDFQLSKPGKYSVQAQRYDGRDAKAPLVKSNIVAFTITD
jgi:hypothetical protein